MSGEDQQTMKPSSQQLASPREEDDVNELLARLHSAMNIEAASNSEPEPSTSNDFSSELLDYSLLTNTRKTSSAFSSSLTLHDDGEMERSTLHLDSPSPTRQASTSLDISSLELDTTSRADDTSTRAMEDTARARNSVSGPESRVLISASEQEIILPWDKKKKGKKMSKSEMEKRRKELDMWNASDSTVLEITMSGSGGMLYGGDEIGALVLDPGHHSLRVGYAQEDTPKADIPSVVGAGPAPHIPDPEEKLPDGNVTQTGAKGGSDIRHYIDVTEINVPRPNMEVLSYMKDGQVDNWDLFEKVLDYCYAKVIRSPSEQHPVLLTEAVWTSRACRERLAELMFERYQAPAFFLVKNAVLAAFANGKSTALVVDAGASQTSAVPVVDGYALAGAATRSHIGGDHLAQQAKQLIASTHIQMLPVYSIQSKEVIRERERARYVLKTLPAGLTQSWQDYMLKRQYEDFVHCVAQVSEVAYDERTAVSVPGVHYEFPGGYHQDFGPERFKLTECLFEPTVGASHLACAAVSACDADARPALWGAVVVCGGAANTGGWLDRLSRDLNARAPSSHRLKTHAAPAPAERRFAAWIGGSILASIGSFQQMWISSQEYDEAGKGQLERKCP